MKKTTSFLILALISIGSSYVVQAANNGITIKTYQSTSQWFSSNSHILLGEKDAIIIDAQFNEQQAEKAIEIVKDSGRHLKGVIITHSHPDHYYGLPKIITAYPNVTIYAAPLTMSELQHSLEQWTLARPLDYKLAVLDDVLTIFLDDSPIRWRVFAATESIENTVILLPKEKVMFSGDLASNQMHLWLAEGRLNNWLSALRTLVGLSDYSMIYPGHGLKAGREILQQSHRYIEDFISITEQHKSKQAVIDNMRVKYPQYGLQQVLLGSAQSLVRPSE